MTKQVSIYWKAIDTWVTFLIADFDAFPIILGAAVVKQFIKFPEQIQFWNDNTMQLVDTQLRKTMMMNKTIQQWKLILMSI